MTENETTYPRGWRFEDDGDRLDGRYVGIDEGTTSNGPCPIAVLEVDGERRAVWLFHAALRLKFMEEVKRRASGDLTVGERVAIERGQMRDGANGRKYRGYTVQFPDAPTRTAADILAAGATRFDGEHDDETPF